MSAAPAEAPGPVAPEAKQVLYCPHCTFPPEYCTFSSSASKCKAWLIENHPEQAEKIYGSSSTANDESNSAAAASDAKPTGDKAAETGLETKLEEGLTLKQKEDEDREREKKERREEKKKEKEDKERKAARIVLTKHARTKKKATTSIAGLHFFQPPLPQLKVISKGLASRLATGCSVSKSASNPNVEEITIQGDVAEEVKEMILNRVKPFNEVPPGVIGESQIKVEEEKKKAPKEPAPGAE
ncbi:unnamed protein product [Sympodiomycopsis kandeliae]